MNAALERLLREKGDLAFPHAADTGEELLRLFQTGRTDGVVPTARLTELMRRDPGFAFNAARSLREGGVPQGDGCPVDLAKCLERRGAFHLAAILAPQELHADTFAAHPQVATAFRRVAAAAVVAARQAAASVPTKWCDTATMMALRSALPLLGIANLVPDKALPILRTASAANDACREAFGFSLMEFGHALNQRYRLPEASNAAYPREVRDAVSAATSELTRAAAARIPAPRPRRVKTA